MSGPIRETDVTVAINNLTRQAERVDELAVALVKALDSVLAPAAEGVAPSEGGQNRVALAQRIVAQADKLRSIGDVLEQVIKRLEL